MRIKRLVKLLVLLAILIVWLLTLQGRRTGPSTSDYVREHGLPADPYDRTPPANR